MRIEIWFDNSNTEAMMRCFGHVDAETIREDNDELYFELEKDYSDHAFRVNKKHVAFIEYMPTNN